MWTIMCVKEKIFFFFLSPVFSIVGVEHPGSGTQVQFFVKWWTQWSLNMLLWLPLPRNSSWPSRMRWPLPCHLVVASSRWFNPAQADGKRLMAVVGREPKCLTLWETVCSLQGTPGRSQQVWASFAVFTPVPPRSQPHFPASLSPQWSSSMRKGKGTSGKSSASFFGRSSLLVHCQLAIDLKSRMTGQYTFT